MTAPREAVFFFFFGEGKGYLVKWDACEVVLPVRGAAEGGWDEKREGGCSFFRPQKACVRVARWG